MNILCSDTSYEISMDYMIFATFKKGREKIHTFMLANLHVFR
jgi:hypothetical protein